MFNKFTRAVKILHRGEKGITGLETAIILIAFVTVASVLAYTVLSAGVFSAEKGKQAVYAGLDQAQSSMQVKGDVIALSSDYPTNTDNATISTVQFTVASVLADETVDMTDQPSAPPETSSNNTVVINFSDSSNAPIQNVEWSAVHEGPARFGQNMLGPGEQMLITVTIPPGVNLSAYDTFTLQIVPPKGAVITIQRNLPASIMPTNDLN